MRRQWRNFQQQKVFLVELSVVDYVHEVGTAPRLVPIKLGPQPGYTGWGFFLSDALPNRPQLAMILGGIELGPLGGRPWGRASGKPCKCRNVPVRFKRGRVTEATAPT